jgi:hypothetical protein
MSRHFRMVVGIASCVLSLVAGTATADFIPPTGLAPGSKYQILFVTSGTINGESSDINVYNTFVQTQAALNPSLPAATWSAVASTWGVNANVNAPLYDGVTIYNTLGQTLGGGPATWDEGFLYTWVYDQYGGGSGTEEVWTGTDLGGVVAQVGGNCAGLGGFSPAIGSIIPSGWMNGWLWNENGYSPDELSLYALSSPITVPTPEPSTLALLGVGAVSLLAYACRRRVAGVKT